MEGLRAAGRFVRRGCVRRVKGCESRNRGVKGVLPFAQLYQVKPPEAGEPCSKQLTQQNDAAEVIGVVGGERDELVADGHGADGMAGT